MMKYSSWASCLMLWTTGCSSGVDVDAERRALLETDRAWASAAAAGEMENGLTENSVNR